MVRMAAGGARLRVDRLDANHPHQALNALAVGPDTLTLELAFYGPATATGVVGI